MNCKRIYLCCHAFCIVAAVAVLAAYGLGWLNDEPVKPLVDSAVAFLRSLFEGGK